MTVFNDSKYTRWYYSITGSAQSRLLEGYSERHHIIPKSMGGSNDPDNLVDLTAREHFVVHWLLTKMVSGRDRFKMLKALGSMSTYRERRNLSSRCYEVARRASIEAQRGRSPSKETREKLSKAGMGRKLSQEHVQALKEKLTGRPLSEEHRKKLSIAHKGNRQSDDTKKKIGNFQKGRPKSEETKKKMREAAKRRNKSQYEKMLVSRAANKLKALA